MANINSLRIGDVTPDVLMLDKPYIKEYGDELIKDYYKYANDAGGYYVHGLWLAPGHEDGVYWWPWDLGVAGGALKDVNDGSARWGYVQDGENKNITSGMNNSFPDNGWGTSNWNVVLCIYGNSTGNSTIGSNPAYDFTECPIVIKFSEDFISGATVDILNSADVDVSEDGTTFTINKLKVNDRVIKFTWTDTSLSFIRQKLTNVIVDVTGLDYHYQGVKSEVDYSSVEVWDAYIGDTQVYHKDKTVENCLEKYKYCKYVSPDTDDEDGRYQIAKDSSMTANNIIVPIPIDFDSLFRKRTSFNIVASNNEFWDAVKENAQNIGLIVYNSNYKNLKGVFQDSNISGAITIKVLNSGNVPGDRMFENVLLNEINFTYVSDIDDDAKNQFTSINTLFKSTPNLKTITSSKDFLARDMSGCFEYSGIEEIPGIILYSARTYNEVKGANPYCSITSWFCDGCSKLTIINRYRGATNREDNNNVIKFQSAYYSFNNCSQLVTIDPILDFEYVRPSASQNAFSNCGKLTDVRIRNLNHGDWHLDDDSQQGNLSALNQESVEYLFANLKDLTTRNPDLVFSGGVDGDEGWNGNEFAANPDVIAANLYCPSSWESYITSEMITPADAKGWTVYIGGEPAWQPHDYLIDAWIFSGHTNEEAPTQITGEKGTALSCYNFAWNEEGSGFKDGELCFDKVDDYLINENMPLLDDFTVIMRRTASGDAGAVVYKGTGRDYNNGGGAFQLEILYNGSNVIINRLFGKTIQTKGVGQITLKDEAVSFTPTSIYKGLEYEQNFERVSKEDGPVLKINSPLYGNNYYIIKMKYFALYSKTLTNEEIQFEKQKLDALWESRKQ